MSSSVITAETTDDQLHTLAAGDEQVLAQLQSLRHQMREDLRQALAQVAHSHQELIHWRDALIVRLYSCGDSLRSIAALTNISHGTVKNIVSQSRETE